MSGLNKIHLNGRIIPIISASFLTFKLEITDKIYLFLHRRTHQAYYFKYFKKGKV